MDVHAARTAVYWLHSSPPAAGRRTLRKKLVFPYRASHLAAGASLFCSPNAFRATFTNGLCIARPHSASITRGILVMSLLPPPFSSPSVAERSDRHNPFTKILRLNLPCYHPLAVFLPRLGFASMLLLNRVRKYALVAIFRIHFLARKRCFLGGTDTSGGVETLRQSPGLLTDGGRRKKRDVDFTIPKHIGIRARVEYGFQRIKHRIGERGAIQRRQPRRCGSNHWRPPRNRVRGNPG